MRAVLKRFVYFFAIFCCSVLATPAYARRAPMQRHRHRIIRTRYNLALAHRTLRRRRTHDGPRAHFAQPALAESVAAAISPQPSASGSDVHPIILSAVMKPAVLIVSGTVTPASATRSDIRPVMMTAVKPAVLVASGTVTASTHVEVPSPRVLLTTTPAPEPVKPYVLPGHALPLDTELTLLHEIGADPTSAPLSGDSFVDPHPLFDLGVSGTALLTPATSGNDRPALHPQTTGGALFNVGIVLGRWVNFQFNYQFSRLAETSNSTSGQSLADVATNLQEFTGEYLISGTSSGKRWSPFLGLGGGILSFGPGSGQSSAFTAQTRTTFLADPGVRIPTPNPHINLRIDARLLDYRAPSFNSPTVTNPHWTVTVEPSLGLLLRF